MGEGRGEGRGEGQKRPATSFSPVTSTNVRISPWNILTFSFNLLPHWCKVSRPYLVPVPNYWTWTMSTQEKIGFCGQILIITSMVMITSLIVMRELSTFGHMFTFTIWFESHNKMLLVASLADITFISKWFYFCWHHQNSNHVY